jgi:hypothetical protein
MVCYCDGMTVLTGASFRQGVSLHEDLSHADNRPLKQESAAG